METATDRSAMSRTGLVLADLLVEVWCVQPPGLLLLSLGVRMETGGSMDSILMEGERGDGGRNLHLSPGSGALQQHGEAVGVTCPVTLKNPQQIFTLRLIVEQYATDWSSHKQP